MLAILFASALSIFMLWYLIIYFEEDDDWSDD